MSQFLFRADASVEMGSGHIMRCMTLAQALIEQGHQVRFITRDLPGHLAATLSEQRLAYDLLTTPKTIKASTPEPQYPHSYWLPVSQQTDFDQCQPIIHHWQPDWVLVDHYALSAVWEQQVKQEGAQIAVIDDLADRPHQADILIDQNLGHNQQDYRHLLPPQCRLLLGPQYALLRPEFAQWRPYSLKRRAHLTHIQNILINLGGVDKDNITTVILDTLDSCVLPENIRLTVIMGRTAPHLASVQQRARDMHYQTVVLSDIHNMAELMAHSDLAIGAAGSTAWERCCMGLPSILILLADNQKFIAQCLTAAHAAYCISQHPLHNQHNFKIQLQNQLRSLMNHNELTCISINASKLVNNTGTDNIIQNLIN